MKKIALVFASIVLIASVITFTACDKTNTTAPVVVLVGAASITNSLNATFTDPGATATDHKGAVLTVTVTESPAFNKNLAGTYTFTYSATDVDGNKGEATRTVTVQNDAYNYAGVYNNVANHVTGNGIVDLGDYLYNATLTPSTTQNNRVAITNFSGLGTPVVVDVTITSSAVSIACPYLLIGVPAGYEGSITSATGTVSSTIPNFTLTYRVTYDSPAGTYNDNADTFTK